MRYDEGEHVKEVFAYFGRAIYEASCVETGLVHALLHMDYLAAVGKEFKRTKGQGFNRAKYEADFDAFMETHFAQTLGNLIRRLDMLTALNKELKEQITAAKKWRDFLVHHFWRERAEEFATREGRSAMIVELNADAEMFEKLDDDIQKAMKPAREALGMKDDILDKYVREFIAQVEKGERPK